MSINISVICRKDRATKNNTAPIFIRFTHNRKARYVSTGVNVNVEDWNFDNQRIKDGATDGSKLQYQIDTKLHEYDKKMRRLEVLDIEVTLNNLLGNNNRKAICTLSDCFDREITRLESLGKYTSASKYKVTLSLLNQFRSANIRLEEIDLVYLNDFELFLRKKGNKDNSIATKFSVFKAVYNKAVAEDLAPFYLDFAWDIFLFTYYTAGINIGDIARLEHLNIRNGRIYYTRHKTGKEIACKLMPTAVQIIEKYNSPFYDDADYISGSEIMYGHKKRVRQKKRTGV